MPPRSLASRSSARTSATLKTRSGNSAAGSLIARAELEAAADLLADTGMRTDEAYARLRVAERLASEGRGAEAQPQLEQALAFYRSVGATRYVRRGEELLPASA